MEYLIWGAGRGTQSFIDVYYSCYFYENPIKAIVDNDENKWGKIFFGLSVIGPKQIEEYSFDKILICNHYKIITEQIRNGLGIEENRITTKDEVLEQIYKRLIYQKSVFGKRFLIVGDRKRYCQIEHQYVWFANVIGVIDYNKLEELSQYSFDYILLMNLMDIPEITNKRKTLMFEDELLIEQIMEKSNSKRERILSNGAFLILMNRIYKEKTMGVENPDKRFLVFRGGGTVGFGAIICVVSKLMAYAKENGYILVIDLMTNKNQYLEEWEVGRVNAWEKFFLQPSGYTLEDIKNSQNIYVIQKCTNIETESKSNLDFLRERPELEEKVWKYKRSYLNDGRNIVGVVYRGSDYINRKPYGHFVQPDLTTLLNTVEEKMVEWKMNTGKEKIFLATEVEEAVDAFEERFPNQIMYYPQNRVPIDYDEYLASYKFSMDNDAYRRGADYWVVLNILAGCDSLIGGKNGATTVATMMNRGKYRNIFLFDLGTYGIDDRYL